MTEPRFDAVVVGAVGVDTNVYLPSADLDLALEGTFCSNRDCVGQAGGYASQAFARLGRRTALIGHVGEDHCGQLIREQLTRQGVDLTGLFIDPQGTKRSVNLMRPDGTRNSFYDGRGAMTLQPDLDVCRAILARTGLVHVNIVNWSRHLLPVARDLGVTISTDLQDVIDVHDEYRRDYIAQSDILFFSCVNHADPRPFIDHFFAAGPARAVITGMGARGCALAIRGEDLRQFDPVPWGEPVVDTNGAGDCLAVGFLVSHVLEGRPPGEAVLRGQICARHCCTLRGDSASLLTAEELADRAARLRR